MEVEVAVVVLEGPQIRSRDESEDCVYEFGRTEKKGTGLSGCAGQTAGAERGSLGATLCRLTAGAMGSGKTRGGGGGGLEEGGGWREWADGVARLIRTLNCHCALRSSAPLGRKVEPASTSALQRLPRPEQRPGTDLQRGIRPKYGMDTYGSSWRSINMASIRVWI